MSRAIHHLALGARDVERVARFYRETLGLPEVVRHLGDGGVLRSVWLRAGETVLMIERTEVDSRAVTGVGAGPFLVAFSVTPAERAELEARVAIESRSEHSSYFRDPEGNRVAVSHYPLP